MAGWEDSVRRKGERADLERLRRDAGSQGNKLGEDVGKGAPWGHSPCSVGTVSLRGLRAEDEWPGLALRQNCQRRGGAAVCPPVELSERCGGEEGQRAAGPKG